MYYWFLESLTETLTSSERRVRVLPPCCLHDSGRPRRGQGCPCISQRWVGWDLVASGLLQRASCSGAVRRRDTSVSVHLVSCSMSPHRGMTWAKPALVVCCIKLYMIWATWHTCLQILHNNTDSANIARQHEHTCYVCTMTYYLSRPPSRMLLVG